VKRTELFREVSGILEREPKLIRLPSHGRAVFVGDTHGDVDATEKVVSRFLKGSDALVFLGDYVDRGSFSRENVDILLRAKREHPDTVFLLAGNHEGYLTKRFSPANFWESLGTDEAETYSRLFSKFPLAATSANGLLALHGGLPDLDSLEEIDRIEWGDRQWERILWGDFVDGEEESLEHWSGRPQLSRPYFERMMDRYRKRVLIRSHQPYAPLFMFKKRCVTIFTSDAYVPDRMAAIVAMDREIRTGDDLVLEEV